MIEVFASSITFLSDAMHTQGQGQNQGLPFNSLSVFDRTLDPMVPQL